LNKGSTNFSLSPDIRDRLHDDLEATKIFQALEKSTNMSSKSNLKKSRNKGNFAYFTQDRPSTAL
jgi:hypothetical protein